MSKKRSDLEEKKKLFLAIQREGRAVLALAGHDIKLVAVDKEGNKVRTD